jgi:preprotein translocase subunit SecG
VKNFPIHSVLQVIQLISSVLLILAILLQTPKSSSGLGGTIGGGGGDSGGGYRTRRGLENTLFQITIGLTIVFVIVSVVNIKLG